MNIRRGRPITLIGYGIGARTIFNCLEILAERSGGPYVENAVFIGAPIGTSTKAWEKVRSVCSGRYFLSSDIFN